MSNGAMTILLLQITGSIKSDTLLVLVNALYFKSEFENSFDDDETSGTFETTSGDVKVNMLESADISVGTFGHF